MPPEQVTEVGGQGSRLCRQCPYLHRAGLPLHGAACPRDVAQLAPADLQGGVHGRNLADFSAETRQNRIQCRTVRQADSRSGRQNDAGCVLGVGAQSQAQNGFVGFFIVRHILGCLGGSPQQQDQHAGRHGVQRAGVPDLPGTEQAADTGHDIVRGHACGLVYKQNAVRCGAFFGSIHGYLRRITSVRIVSHLPAAVKSQIINKQMPLRQLTAVRIGAIIRYNRGRMGFFRKPVLPGKST